ncbi:MAG: hypothetical protein ACI4IX_01045 [Acutalibacteraceae bacterium]
MKLFITNRARVEKMGQDGFMEKTALISITDYGDSDVELKNPPEFLLRLSFDDVPLGKALEAEYGRKLTDEEIAKAENELHALTDEQAKSIVDFYNEVYDRAHVLICQCEHGESRSAAIAAAIMEHRYKKGINIFADERFCPNKSIYKKILFFLSHS